MSVVEQSRDRNDSWMPNPLYFIIKKCCNTCNSFKDDQLHRNTGWCLENITNDLYGEYIKDSNTFYCSYHKFKV